MAQVVSQNDRLRVAIIGNSGSGKSTLARHLAAECTLPLLDLDTVAWEPGKVAVPRDPLLSQREVDSFCLQNKGWILEGCYADLVAVALRYDPVLLFLNPGTKVCQHNCQNRPWEPHKYESKAAQDALLPFLLSWVAEYETRQGPMSLREHSLLFDAYAGKKRKLIEQLLPTEIVASLRSL